MNFLDYDLKYNINELRKKLSTLGGTPGNKSKKELIEEIIKIEQGELTPTRSNRGRPRRDIKKPDKIIVTLNDSEEAYPGGEVEGVLEFTPDGYGFIRVQNYDNSPRDAFVSKPTIKKYFLREGDFIRGKIKAKRENMLPEMCEPITVNGTIAGENRPHFETLTARYPKERILLGENGDATLRIVDIFAPIGKGQRGLIVAPPKTGKTTLLKKIAKSIEKNHKNIHLIVFLVDERPEEVTDFLESVNAEIIYSTFDSSLDHHVKISELLQKRLKSLVESGKDVVLLIDSITKLTRAYNSVIPSSGKILSGGIDPQAYAMPKKLFGLARATDQGSITIISTALIETGSKMDDVIYEEFKGTGNMEIVLSRTLAERRVFPAIDIQKTSTRKEEMLLSDDELELSFSLRRACQDIVSNEKIVELFKKTKSNQELKNN